MLQNDDASPTKQKQKHARVLDAVVQLLADGGGEGGGERPQAVVHGAGHDGAPHEGLGPLVPGASVVVVACAGGGGGLREGQARGHRSRGEQGDGGARGGRGVAEQQQVHGGRHPAGHRCIGRYGPSKTVAGSATWTEEVEQEEEDVRPWGVLVARRKNRREKRKRRAEAEDSSRGGGCFAFENRDGPRNGSTWAVAQLEFGP